VGGTSSQARLPVSPRAPKTILRLRGDEELVVRARRGDERAFELLYERHVPGVLSFCRHMLADAAEAEDAVQHTFAAAHRELVESDRPLHVKAWLYTVARNRCLSLLRDRHEHPTEQVEPSTAGLQDVVEQRADLREVLNDLRDLPPDQRAALVLAEMEDLSHAEIAGVIGCPDASVKGLVFRARAGLMERQEAREAPCTDIRAELAVARRGGLRRGRLKHHLKECSSCTAYLHGLKRQRKLLALVLPVAPTAGLKPGLLASLGLGGGAAAGGLAAAGTAGTAATVAVAAVIGGAGLAGHGPLGTDPPDGDSASPPASQQAPQPAADRATPGLRLSVPGALPGARTKGGGTPGPRPADGRRRSSLGARDRGRSKSSKAAKPLKFKRAPAGAERAKPPKEARAPASPTPAAGRPPAPSSPVPATPRLPEVKLNTNEAPPSLGRGLPQNK